MKNVMIVYSDNAFNEFLKLELQSDKFNILSAYNTNQALDILKANNIDMVILDSEISDESGFDLCKKIRKISKMPILFLSTKTDEASILKGFDSGADDYITIPFSTITLKRRISRLTSRF